VLSKIYHEITVKQGLALAGAYSALALLMALTAQFGFSLHPCDLCIYQRYPYAAVAVLAGAAYWLAKSPKQQRAALWLCAALLLLDAGIATYHTGVEYGWFPGPDACSNTDSGEMTIEQMRAAIMNAPLVTCSQAMAYFFGLSMAAWNALAALGMTAVTVLILRKAP